MAARVRERAVPTVPPASGEVEDTTSVGVMVTVMDLLAVALALSVTSAVKVKFPEAVGVPLRIPTVDRVSPVGGVPLEIVHE